MFFSDNLLPYLSLSVRCYYFILLFRSICLNKIFWHYSGWTYRWVEINIAFDTFKWLRFCKYLKAKRNKENNHTQRFSKKHKTSLKERVIESHNFAFAIFRFYQICFSINLESFRMKRYTAFIKNTNLSLFESPKDSITYFTTKVFNDPATTIRMAMPNWKGVHIIIMIFIF